MQEFGEALQDVFQKLGPRVRFQRKSKVHMKLKKNFVKYPAATSNQTAAPNESYGNPAATQIQPTAAFSPIMLLRLPQVLARFPVARSTWYAGVSTGQYPKPIVISKRSVAWTSKSIDELIARQLAQSVTQHTNSNVKGQV